MMAESLREQALVALKAKLEAMTGTRPWGGTYPNAPKVTRTAITLAQSNYFPTLVLKEGDGSQLDFFETDSIFRHRFVVSILGYVKGDEDVSRSTWLQRLWDDTIKTLQAGRTLSGLASDIEINAGLDVDDGELEPSGGFAQDITVVMYESMTVE